MQHNAIKLLSSHLHRIKEDHTGRLLLAGNNALTLFDPSRKNTFKTSLIACMEAITQELSEYCTQIHVEVVSIVEHLMLPLSDEAKAKVLELASHFLDDSLYLKRLDIQIEGMVRKGNRCGIKVEEWDIRIDVERSLYQINTMNLIRRRLVQLSDDLELMRLRFWRTSSVPLSTIGEVKVPFSELMNDTIDILKSDGTEVAGRKASVQKNKIFMEADGLLIEPGDLILRRMSNGAKETYRVIDPGFHEDFHQIKAHYQMDVHKLGMPEAKSAVQNITYNVSGNNTRINQNSVDNSTNVVHIDNRALQHIEALRQELKQVDLPESDRAAAFEIVDEVEEAFRSGKPKKTIVSALLSSLPNVANIATIVSAIASCL